MTQLEVVFNVKKRRIIIIEDRSLKTISRRMKEDSEHWPPYRAYIHSPQMVQF